MNRFIVLVTCGVLAVAMPAAAQGNGAAWEKGWLDVNFGVAAAAESDYGTSYSASLFQETAAFAVAYSAPTGGSFDVGGGYMFTPRVGVGVSLAGTAHESEAGLAIIIPHPFIFNAKAADADVTAEKLTRSEGAWHIQAMFVPVQTPRLRVRAFAGPSFIRAEQEIVSNIRYTQAYLTFSAVNSVNITSYDTEKSDGSAWGFHAGADLSVFFNRVVGVGTVLRVSRATVEMEDYGGMEKRKVGGVQFGGGLRLKF